MTNSTLNDKNAKLQQDIRARSHRENECGPITVGNAIFVKKLSTYYGYIDCVLICTAVVDSVARFSGYTDDGNLVGQFRWNAADLNNYIARDILTILEG